MNTPKSTLEYILKGIIDSDSVSVSEEDQDGVLVLSVTAPHELIGQIIGKEGKVIKAIRSVLNLTYPNQRYLIQLPEAPTAKVEDNKTATSEA